MTSPTTFKLGYPKLKYSVVPMASGAPFQRDPTTSDYIDPKVGKPYAIGTVWPNEATGGIWMLAQSSAGVASWLGITDAASGNVDGPASATDNALARFDGTTGKLIQNSVGILTDAGILTGVRPTLPAGTATAGTAPLKFTAGVNLTSPEAGAIEFDGTNLYYTNSTPTRKTIATVPTSGGAAATKGTFTLTAGASGDINTTAVAANSVIALTITTLGTVATPQAMLATITPGTKFVITSADATDTSSGTWAIVG